MDAPAANLGPCSASSISTSLHSTHHLDHSPPFPQVLHYLGSKMWGRGTWDVAIGIFEIVRFLGGHHGCVVSRLACGLEFGVC